MPNLFKTDQALWYNVGIWGKFGYAIPNFGDGAQTNNQTINYLVGSMGRNLSAIMHMPDVDVRTPPRINCLYKVHMLVMRARTIVGAYAVAPGTAQFEGQHISPGVDDQLIYPVPFFGVRNPFLRQYAGIVLACIADCMQSQENALPNDISTDFGAMVGSYLTRLYTRMACELFGIAPAVANVPGYTLQQADLNAYNPALFFTKTELIDVTPPVGERPTDMDLRVLTDGIPARQVAGICTYPDGTPYYPGSLGNSEIAADNQPNTPGPATPWDPTTIPDVVPVSPGTVAAMPPAAVTGTTAASTAGTTAAPAAQTGTVPPAFPTTAAQ
jgi:hypothetical protein